MGNYPYKPQHALALGLTFSFERFDVTERIVDRTGKELDCAVNVTTLLRQNEEIVLKSVIETADSRLLRFRV